jgi:hypothetical protein
MRGSQQVVFREQVTVLGQPLAEGLLRFEESCPVVEQLRVVEERLQSAVAAQREAGGPQLAGEQGRKPVVEERAPVTV